MRRYSISNLMAVTALVAANFASLRLMTPPNSPGPQDRSFIFLGLVPLVDVTLIGLWSILRRHHIKLERRTDRRPFMFVWACTLLLAIAIVGGMLLPSAVMGYMDGAVEGLLYLLPWLKPMINSDTVQSRMVYIPVLLGLILSGPPILFALAWSFVARRYRLVITPREEQI